MATNSQYIFKGNVDSVSDLPQIAEDKSMYYVISQRTYYAFNGIDKVWVTADTIPTWKNVSTATLDVSGSALTVDNQYAETAGDAAKLGGYDPSHYSVVGHTHVKADITDWAHTHAINLSDGTNSGSTQTDTETLAIQGTSPIATNFVDETNTLDIDISLIGSNGVSVTDGDISLVYGGNGSANTPSRSDHTHVGTDITSQVASAANADMLNNHIASVTSSANTIVIRDANKDIFVNAIHGTADNATLLQNMSATSSGTANTVVSRDANGDFSAGTITATLNGNASNANKLNNLDSSQFIRSDLGKVEFGVSSNYVTTNRVFQRIGAKADAKPVLVLFAKKYNGTDKLVRQGFEGFLYVMRGNTTCLNYSKQYRIICVSAYEATKLYIDGNASNEYLVETTYNNEEWYGFFSPLQSARDIIIDGFLFGTPVFIPDATNYTVTKVNGDDLYINQNKVWNSNNDGAGSGLDADKLDGLQPATGANANTIVQRDASGNFSAGTITADLSGNASTASKWQTAKSISLSGDVTGSTSVDGSANATISTAIPNKTSANTPNTIVERDANGNFSAGTITATLSGAADTLTTPRNISLSGDASGSVAFDGSSDVVLSATVNNASELDGKASTSYEQVANKGVANGYASLDNTAKMPIAQIPTTFASDIDMANFIIHNVGTPNSPHDAANKDYVDAYMHGLEWQDSVKSKSLLAPPSTPATDDRYIVGTSATDDWASHDNEIAQYDGTAWQFITVNVGTATWIEDEGADYVYNGTSWVKFGATINHNNTNGLQGGTTTERYHLTFAQYTDVENSTSSNTPSTIVKRDANGNFSANTITALINGSASNNVLKTGDTMSDNLNFSTDNTGLTFYGNGKLYKKAGSSITVQPDKDSIGFTVENTSGSAVLNVKTDGDTNGMKYYGNVVWHEGNDGTGSGLDADKLDGIESTEFWKKAGTWLSDLGNYNYVRQYGIEEAGGNLSVLTNNSQISLLIDGNYFSGEGNGFYSFPSNNSSAKVGFYYNAGNFYINTEQVSANGKKVWHEGNDGAGSGLDADKLDNMQPDINATPNTIVQRDASGNITGKDIHTNNIYGLAQEGDFANVGVSTCTGSMPLQYYIIFPEKMQIVGNDIPPINTQYNTGSSWESLSASLSSFNTPPLGATQVQQIWYFDHGVALNAIGIIGSINISVTVSIYSSADNTTWKLISQSTLPSGQPWQAFVTTSEIWTKTTPYVKVVYTFPSASTSGNQFSISEVRWYTSYGGKAIAPSYDAANGKLTYSNDIIAPNITAQTALNGHLIGNADTASKWETTRTISLSGDATGSTSIDGSSDITINANINKATSNTPSTVVQRDTNGDFSAGTITATLNGTASNANTLQTHPASDFVLKGGDTMSGDLDMGTKNITNVQEMNMTSTGVLKHGTSTVIDADGKVWGAVYNDIAEAFEAGEELEPGDVVSYSNGKVYKCKRFDTTVVGVVTENPSIIMGITKEEYESPTNNKVLVAIAGRVPVKVIGNTSRLRPGSILCADTNGKARVGISPGSIVGKTLEITDNNHVLAMVMLG